MNLGASCLGARFSWGELSWGDLSLGRLVLFPCIVSYSTAQHWQIYTNVGGWSQG